ncbi:MAG: ubiquinol oxidase subunit II [Desulforhopalus sp.]
MNQTHDPPFRFKKSRPVFSQFSALFLTLVAILTVFLLGGCSDMVLLHPKGPIGEIERYVIIIAFVLMLIVVIPVIIMAFWFPWKYRASNTQAEYAPKWNYSGKIELAVWLIPAAIVSCLGVLIWHTTFQVDPYRPLDSTVKPVEIQAVSLDWKWLFIYPEQNIAVVNQLVFPVDVPLNFKITSDTVMTSFFIPQLGSQIYAMAGMETMLHLMATEAGTFRGQNQQISGTWYSEMNFEAIATTPEEYEAWLAKIRTSTEKLDPDRYQSLVQPTAGYPVTYFSSVEQNLFKSIIGKYMPSTHNHGSASGGESNSMHMQTAGPKGE